MNFYIDLIIYIFAILGIIVTNLALFENYIVKVQERYYILRKNDKAIRYLKKGE